MTTLLTLGEPATPAAPSPAAASLVESIVTEPRLPAKVTRRPPVTIDTLLTKHEFVRLILHMANDNPISHFLVAWTDDEGKPRHAKAYPHRRADLHAEWTYDAITGNAKRKTSTECIQKTTPTNRPGGRSTSTHMSTGRMSLRRIGQSGRLR
jgi:hypothetical protein